VRRVRCRSVVFVCIALCGWARAATAGLAFPSLVERVTGTRIDVAPVRASLGNDAARLRVEFADAELYGVPGLRMSGVRASGARHGVFVSAAITNVMSPVGAQARAVMEAGCTIHRAWQGGVRAGAERLSLDAEAPLISRMAGVVSRVDVGRVTTVADLEVLDGIGGYETSMSLSTRVHAGAAALIGHVRIDGDRFVGAGISGVARLHECLALLAGYDDGAQSLGAGIVINWRGVEIATGVFQHPVLGMSQGVSVACFR
jgi:hypothetical protein